METKVLSFCLLTIYSSLLILALDGAIYRWTDPCPEPNKPGDTWNKDNCQQCHCLEKGYECYSCGKTAFQGDTMNCYAYFKKNETYPECCKQYIKCRGEEEFDENWIIG